MTRPFLALLSIAAACGDAIDAPDAGPLSFDGGTCTASVATFTVTSAQHVPQGTPLSYISNPPAGGDHYPDWLRWAQRYDVLERGNYIHNQEHGGVILINPCETGCDEVSLALEQVGRSLPQDPDCIPPINARWLVVRDPLVPRSNMIAAAAWGATFLAPCFDEAKLRAFIMEHYAKAPEDLCFDGRKP